MKRLSLAVSVLAILTLSITGVALSTTIPNNPGSTPDWELAWVKLLDPRSRASMMLIELSSEGEMGTMRESPYAIVISELPQIFTVRISDGEIINKSSSFMPPSTGVPVGMELYTDRSGNGRYIVNLKKSDGSYVIYVYDVLKNNVKTIPVEYRTDPLPMSIKITYSGEYILVGDQRGYLACYKSTSVPDVPPLPFTLSKTEPFTFSEIEPPGIYIVAGGETGNKAFLYGSNSTKIFDYNTGGKITSVAISDDGKYVVIGSENNKVYFLGTNETSHPIWKYQSTDDINTVDISSNGSCVVVGDEDGRVLYWSKAETLSGNNPDPDWTYNTIQSKNILSVSISDDGTRVGVGGENKRVYFLDNGGNLLWSQVYQTGEQVSSVAVSNDGKYLVAGSDDEWIYFFGEAEKFPLWKYNIDHKVRAVAISYYGEYVAAGSDHDDVYFFDATSGVPLWSYDGHGKSNDLSMSYSGRYLVSAGDGGRVYYFDTRSASPLWTWKTPGKLNSVSMSHDGSIVVAGGDHDEVYYWFGAMSLFSSEEGGKKYGEGPAWSVDLGGKVNSVAVTSVYGPTVTLKQEGMDALVLSSETTIVYVDSSNNIYTGALTSIVDSTNNNVWPMDDRGWFPYAHSGTIKEGATVALIFTYPGETYGLGQSPLPAGTYQVYLLAKGIAYDGEPFTQRIECGTTSIE